MSIRSIAYKSVEVKNASLRFLKKVSQRSTIHVGIDIGKKKLYVVVRWTAPRSKEVVYENPWVVRNPDELPMLIGKFLKMGKRNKVIVGIEATGSYGDPLRQYLGDAEIIVHQLRTKLTHDYAEIFDGVPSQHDGKDAAVIAELLAQGKSTPWPFAPPTEIENEMHYLVKKMIYALKDFEQRRSRLEALIAYCWPELPNLLTLASISMLKLLIKYGGPTEFRSDPNAKENLSKFSHRRFTAEKVEGIVQSAKTTKGVRQYPWDIQALKDIGEEMFELRKKVERCTKRLKELIEQSSPRLQRLSKVLGVGTASVIWDRIGDPIKYHCADAWIKAMGLNLVERSSGDFKGDVRISKRGSSEVRRWLYMSAIRWIQKSPVKEWYQRKKLRTGNRLPGEGDKRSGGKAIVAVMRKLLKGFYHSMIHDVSFDPKELFFKESSKKKDQIVGCRGNGKRRRPRPKKTQSMTGVPKSLK